MDKFAIKKTLSKNNIAVMNVKIVDPFFSFIVLLVLSTFWLIFAFWGWQKDAKDALKAK